jgi:hypothetical protein
MQRAVNTTGEEAFSMLFAYWWAMDVFYWSASSLYKQYRTESNELARVEAGSNTSTVTLRVVGGD